MRRLAMLRDLRFAIKSLRRSPGFTLIAVITLGLGIGANTSMFSVLNGYMLRPAPYPDRDRVTRIYRETRQHPRGGISPADYLDLKSESDGDIIRLVLTSGTKLALIGSALGLLGAVGISRAFAAAIPGMPTSSVPVMIGATVLLIAIAQIACYIPARYASSISPTEALRVD